jgi:hypothetical protein
MKTAMTIKGIDIMGIKIDELSIEETYTPGEAIECLFGLKKLANEIMDELPHTISALTVAYTMVEKANALIEEEFKQDEKQGEKQNMGFKVVMPENMPEELKQIILNSLKQQGPGLFGFGR